MLTPCHLKSSSQGRDIRFLLLRALGSHWRTLSKKGWNLTQYCLRCGSSVSNHSGSITWELVKGAGAESGPTLSESPEGRA